MKFKILIPLTLFILISLFFIGEVKATEITVCSSGCDSTTVQGGINLASPYDTVLIIDSGEYNESVIVTVAGLNLTSNSTTLPIIWRNGSYPNVPIEINTGNISVSNLKLKYNGTVTGTDCIVINNQNNIFINNINCSISTAGSNGIYFDYNTNNSIVSNSYFNTYLLTANDLGAILIASGSNNNTFYKNTFYNFRDGIEIDAISAMSNSTNIKDNNFYNYTNSIRVYGDPKFNPFLYLVNNSFSKSTITISKNATLYNQYRLNLQVKDSLGNNLNGATVTINDSLTNSYANPTSTFQFSTNSSGMIDTMILTEFLANQTYNATSGYMYFSNYTINVSLAGYHSNQTTVNLTNSEDIMLTMTASGPSSFIQVNGITNGTYPDSKTISCSGSDTCTLWKNGTDVTGQNNTAFQLGVGLYNFTASITGNQTTVWYLIGQGGQSVSLTGITNNTYPYSVTPVCSGNVTSNLYRNYSSASNSTAIQLSGGDYLWTCNTTANNNYTFITTSSIQRVSRASRTCTLATDKLWTRVYDGTASSTSCSVDLGSTDGSMTFTVNTSGVSTPDSQTNAGGYSYVCQWTGGVNYSDCTQQTNILSILLADYSTSLTGIANRTYDGTTTDTPICTSNVTATFVRNSSASTWNNTATVFGVNGYNWTCYVNPDANHRGSSKTVVQSITQASSSCTIFPATSSYAFGIGVTIYATSNTSQSPASLWWNTTSMTSQNNTAITFPVGRINLTSSNQASQNFTQCVQSSSNITVTIGTPAISFTGTTSHTYGTSNTIQCTSNGIANLYLNDSTTTYNNTSILFGVKDYLWTCNTTDTQNYTSDSASSIMSITQATPALSISGTGSYLYPTLTNVSGTNCPSQSDVSCNLYRDSILKSNPDSATLAVGTYAYIFSTLGGVNYTSGTTSSSLSIVTTKTLQQKLVDPIVGDLGVTIPQLLAVFTTLGCVIIMAKDFRLGIMFLFFFTLVEFIMLYASGYDTSLQLIITFCSLAILSLSYLITHKKTQSPFDVM